MVEGVDGQTGVSFVSIPFTALLWILGGDMRRFRHDDLQGNIWSPSWSLREDFFWRGEQKLEEFSHKATAVAHRFFFCLFDRDVD